MRKFTIVFLWLFATVCIHGQNYHINFTASGTATTLDSIFVENLTQGTSLTLQGGDTLHLLGTTDISNIAEPKSFLKIYPNPFNETSHVAFHSETTTMAAIDVYDVVGKHILHLRQEVQRGDNIFQISGFRTGHYQLIVKTETWQKSAAFVSLNTSSQNPKIQIKSVLSKEFHLKASTKSTKNIVQMPYTTGDEMQFTGYSGNLSDSVTDIPISSKTIDFMFTAFTCGDSITFNYNGTNVTYGIVASNGKCWLDRNLGASQVATSSTDTAAYGDLFQWGRAADGHQIRTSDTTSTLSTSDDPGHGDFITTGSSPFNWLNPQNDDLWQGVNGTNNPCPAGWRVPTEAEWNAELLSWSSNNATGAFASPLKLPMAGFRNYSNGALLLVGSFGTYWSSTVSSTDSSYLYFLSSGATMSTYSRTNGLSVRCLKN